MRIKKKFFNLKQIHMRSSQALMSDYPTMRLKIDELVEYLGSLFILSVILWCFSC